jgi:hypothetical protein
VTGFLNFDSLDTVGASVVRAADRRGEPLSALVVVCAAADGEALPEPRVLVCTAEVLRETFSADEVVARRECEFVVLLPGTDEAGAVAACGQFVDGLADDDPAGDLRHLVSVGTATRPPEGGAVLATLVARARVRAVEDTERREHLR